MRMDLSRSFPTGGSRKLFPGTAVPFGGRLTRNRAVTDSFQMPNPTLYHSLNQNRCILGRQTGACNNHNIQTNGKRRLCCTIGFTDNALCTITRNSMSDLFAGSDPQAIARKLIRHCINQSRTQRTKRATAIKALKILIAIHCYRKQHKVFRPLLQQPERYRKHLRTLSKKGHKPHCDPFTSVSDSISQSCSAFCSAASQNLTAIRSCHTLAEAMLLLAMQLLGLVCSLHGNVTPFLLCIYNIMYSIIKTVAAVTARNSSQTHQKTGWNTTLQFGILPCKQLLYTKEIEKSREHCYLCILCRFFPDRLCRYWIF